MIENGIKPVYVFDGKPPTMKSGELEIHKSNIKTIGNILGLRPTY